jgi:hypothetical protein
MTDDRQAPATPPYVAGISLAPALDVGTPAAGGRSGSGGCRHTNRRGMAQDRAATICLGPALATAPRISVADASTVGGGHGTDGCQFVAEGIRIRAQLQAAPGGVPHPAAPTSWDQQDHNDVQPDPATAAAAKQSWDTPPAHRIAAMLQIYEELNDSDSLCSTPPALPLQTILRAGSSGGPLGVLSPTPLTPSLLTLVSGPSGDGNDDVPCRNTSVHMLGNARVWEWEELAAECGATATSRLPPDVHAQLPAACLDQAGVSA